MTFAPPKTLRAMDVYDFVSDLEKAATSIDWVPAFADAHKLFLIGIENNFQFQVSRKGKIWKPRKRWMPQHPLLKLTLAMYNAAAVEGGSGQVNEVSGNTATWGIDLGVVPYARAQNFGFAPKNIPSREYFYISDETAKEIKGVFQDYGASQLGFN